MEYEAQLKLQAYLDGELPEAEARAVANQLARDEEVTALLGELRQTRKAVAGFEDGMRLPESREFYWSKIQRQIEKLEAPTLQPVRAPSWFARLRYLLVPTAGLALIALIAYLGSPFGTHVPGMETALADSGAFTYHDFSAGTTLVWLSYPAENESAGGEELGSLK
jgi:anti-sigma factor RsiW